MAEKEEKPPMPADVMKANQGIAAQAALRAQQIMFRHKLNSVSISGENTTSAAAALKKTAPPQVPARGDSVLTKKPPEVPPKRNSLKKPIDEPNATPTRQPPPPLPQKPASAQNSPLPVPKSKDKPLSMRPIPPTPQMPSKFDRPPANLPPPIPPIPATMVSTNPFANLRNSPQLNQRSNQPSVNNSPQLSNAPRPPIPPPSTTTSSSSASSKNATPTPVKKQISPIEDLGSEDALRGIESGLRNMERAMQEQMNMRSIEAAAQAKNDNRNFNPMEFKRNIGGSATSLDGSGNNVATAAAQNMSVIESMRMALNKNINMRSMERGFSMDQMRLDQMHLNNSMRNFEANTGNANTGQRPFENHMKSLDRNLPLELQYSRNHNRAHSQQEQVDQLRQNITNPVTAGVSRDDIRLRRRSSHDENQLAQPQTQNNNTGKIQCV